MTEPTEQEQAELEQTEQAAPMRVPSRFDSLHPDLKDAFVHLRARELAGESLTMAQKHFMARCVEEGDRLTETPEKERKVLEQARKLSGLEPKVSGGRELAQARAAAGLD